MGALAAGQRGGLRAPRADPHGHSAVGIRLEESEGAIEHPQLVEALGGLPAQWESEEHAVRLGSTSRRNLALVSAVATHHAVPVGPRHEMRRLVPDHVQPQPLGRRVLVANGRPLNLVQPSALVRRARRTARLERPGFEVVEPRGGVAGGVRQADQRGVHAELGNGCPHTAG